MNQEIRRVVTTLDDTDKAVVLFDGVAPHKTVRPVTGITSWLMWATESAPAEISGKVDRAAVKIGITPPAGGSVFRIVDFPPATDEVAKLDIGHMAEAVGKAHAPLKGRPPRHPYMHRTRSVDYAIVLSGEIDMLLDDTEVHCKTGDVIIQQGTNHAWVNRGTKTCRIAFVLIDAREP